MGDADAATEMRAGEGQAGAVFIVVMGVSGTGKTTLGTGIAKALALPYIEGDELHPKSNIEKMSAGHALNDADREPWLALIRSTAESKIEEQKQLETSTGEKSLGVIISCSALKQYYRDILRGKRKPSSDPKIESKSIVLSEDPTIAHQELLPTYFVFIDGPRDVLLDRMLRRPGHYMKAPMLDGQLRTLESPVGEEGVVVVSAEQSMEEQVRSAVLDLGKLGVRLPSDYMAPTWV